MNNYTDAIEILKYLNKLIDDFSLLPEEVLIKIMKNLDYYQLKTLSKTSRKIEEIYRSKQFESILKNKYWSRQYIGIYGNDEFRIIDKDKPNTIPLPTPNSIRGRPIKHLPKKDVILQRGKFCSTYPRSELIDVMWSIGVQLEYPNYDKQFLIYSLVGAPSHTRLNKQTHSDKEISQWSLNKLNYYYEASNSSKYPNKDILCNLIQIRMDELGVIQYI